MFISTVSRRIDNRCEKVNIFKQKIITSKQEELRANKGKKVDDPFTRRSTKPRMVFKAEDKNPKPVEEVHVKLLHLKSGMFSKIICRLLMSFRRR
jgi:hypothetical protein